SSAGWAVLLRYSHFTVTVSGAVRVTSIKATSTPSTLNSWTAMASAGAADSAAAFLAPVLLFLPVPPVCAKARPAASRTVQNNTNSFFMASLLMLGTNDANITPKNREKQRLISREFARSTRSTRIGQFLIFDL